MKYSTKKKLILWFAKILNFRLHLEEPMHINPKGKVRQMSFVKAEVMLPLNIPEDIAKRELFYKIAKELIDNTHLLKYEKYQVPYYLAGPLEDLMKYQVEIEVVLPELNLKSLNINHELRKRHKH